MANPPAPGQCRRGASGYREHNGIPPVEHRLIESVTGPGTRQLPVDSSTEFIGRAEGGVTGPNLRLASQAEQFIENPGIVLTPGLGGGSHGRRARRGRSRGNTLCLLSPASRVSPNHALRRAKQTLEWSQPNNLGLLSIAIDHLALARVALDRALLTAALQHHSCGETVAARRALIEKHGYDRRHAEPADAETAIQ